MSILSYTFTFSVPCFAPSHGVGGNALGWWELLLNDAKHLLFLTRQPIVGFGDGRMDGRNSAKVGQLWFPTPTPSPLLRGLISWLVCFLTFSKAITMNGWVEAQIIYVCEFESNLLISFYIWKDEMVVPETDAERLPVTLRRRQGVHQTNKTNKNKQEKRGSELKAFSSLSVVLIYNY